MGTRRPVRTERVSFSQPVDTVHFGRKIDDSILNQLVWRLDASQDFVEQALELMGDKLPDALLRDLAADNYSFALVHLVSSGCDDLKKPVLQGTDISEKDLSGGLHLEGDRCIRVAEYLRNKNTGAEEKAQRWQNAIVHEVGHWVVHVIGRKKAMLIKPSVSLPLDRQFARLNERGDLNYYGITESRQFKDAYFKDFNAMPEDVREHNDKLAYFTYPRMNHVPEPRARQEAFAESFDILARGSASDYNFKLFTTHFLNTLKAVADIVREAYPEFKVHPETQAFLDKLPPSP